MTRRLAPALLALIAPGAALAHHPLGGAPMETFAHGLLSGVGHPILGFDHLAFLLALGAAAALTGRALAPLAFLGAMAAAAALRLDPPFGEGLVALSLLALGLALAGGRGLGGGAALGLFALAGLAHGAAFGAAMTGVEGEAAAPVLAGYLLGLVATGGALAALAAFAARRLAPAALRLPGAALAGIGGFLLLEAAEGALLSALA